MNKPLNRVILFLLFLFINISYSQKQEDTKIIVDANFDVRKAAQNYFGNPDLWPYILKYNNIKNLSELKTGNTLLIPQSKVKRMLLKQDEANKAFQIAVLIGAKILAEDLLTKSSASLQQATKLTDSFEYEQADKLFDESITNSKAAYKQTKEIREKTIEAIISFKRGTVQKMFPSILKWEEADLYDNLKENDWARTLTLSNANITFYDLSQIKLNENSQAIIQSSKFDVIDSKTTTKVRLEKGDAYAILLSSPKKKFDLDIKGVKTKINSKYFWVEKGSKATKLSNYNGEISLEVKDSAVVVKKDQGSIIPDGGFPTTPKNLLLPPVLSAPADLVKFVETQPQFRWGKNSNAQSYWLEISTDANFKKVYSTYKNIREEQLQLSDITAGVYYWHVCSVDSTGLPGPYSESRIFIVKFDANKPFLSIEFPPNNFVTRESKIIVKGKTDPECYVTLNQTKTEPDLNGKLLKEFTLTDGRNDLVFSAVNKSGIYTKISLKVFCEINPVIKVMVKTFGELINKMNLTTSESVLRLFIKTRPLSRIEIKSIPESWTAVNYADTLGNCEFNLHPEKSVQEYLMFVKTPAAFEKSIEFTVTKTQLIPKIYFDPEIISATNQESITIKGKVENATELQVNNQKISFDAGGYFVANQVLSKPINDLVIKATSKDGSVLNIERRIIFDNQPPRLISYEVQKLGKEESLYKISIKAEDGSSLKNYAEITFKDNGAIRNEIIKYSKEKNMYEGIISYGEKEKLQIKSIILEDYLTNKKTYEVGK